MEMTHVTFLEQKRVLFYKAWEPHPLAVMYQKIYFKVWCLHKPIQRINVEIRAKISGYFSFPMLEETQRLNLFYVLLIVQFPLH